MSDSPQDAFDTLRRDFNRLREDVLHLTDALKQSGRERAHEAEASLDEELAKARDRLRERVGEAGQRGRAYFEGMEERLGRQPLLGLAVAFGAGFLLARLLTRGEKR